MSSSPDNDIEETQTPVITFTEKEERVLKVAWKCLTSGVPDIDMKKLTELGGFNTEKTASNTWGVIKKKLFSNGAIATAAGPSPAKVKKAATPKKRKAAVKEEPGNDDAMEGVEGTGATPPATKKRKSPTKKAAVRPMVEDAEEGEAVVGA